MNNECVMDGPPLTEGIPSAARGEAGAVERLYAGLYPELRRLAHARLFVSQGQAPGLCTTELVHESFLRLSRARHLNLTDSRHFFAYAATVMRHVIIDIAREHRAARRGGGVAPLALDQLTPADHPTAFDQEQTTLLRIHALLKELERVDPPLARVVEMQYFAGYSQTEIAELTETPVRVVRRQWDKARAFLLCRLRA